MNDQEAEAWRKREIGLTNYRDKLRGARERKGLSIHEAAELMDFPFNSGYYDIEKCDGDLTYCYSLREVKNICVKFDLHPRDLFCDTTSPTIDISDLVGRIKDHCAEKKLYVSEFENTVGWWLETSLANPTKALDEWNIDCLIDVSRELGIDWRHVIAGL